MSLIDKLNVYITFILFQQEKFEDTKGVIRSRKSQKKHTTQWSKEKSTKGQTTIYKTLHRKLKIEQHELHY